MISEHEWNRMIDGKIYAPWKVGGDSWAKVHVAQKKFNESEFWHDKSALQELKKCFGQAPDDMVLTPPVYFDHGNRTYFGEHFYANTGLTILNPAGVKNLITVKVEVTHLISSRSPAGICRNQFSVRIEPYIFSWMRSVLSGALP